MVSGTRRSREGAWIEIALPELQKPIKPSRSREGAWIEIGRRSLTFFIPQRRSREGAWIEILLYRQGLRHGKSLPRGSVD